MKRIEPADRITLSPKAFDKLNALIADQKGKPNQALIKTMARKKRWDTTNQTSSNNDAK